MEGTISEIRIFAGNFPPRNWAFCNGQILSIQSNAALFSLLGTVYGGNGQTTFGLPDLQGRTAVGTGQGPGLSSYTLGEVLGTDTVTLDQTTMASHPHTTVVVQPGTKGTGSATLQCINAGGQAQPGGNYIGADNTAGAKPYAHPNLGATTPMAGTSGTANLTVPPPSVSAISITGGSQPHNNIMPSIAINYIICLFGVFPSRN